MPGFLMAIRFMHALRTCARPWSLLLALTLFGVGAAQPAQARTVPPAVDVAPGAVSSAFSPSGSALALVLRAIGQAQSRIQMAAYVFTSSDVARALVQAKKRGVDVQVLVDWKSNFEEDTRYAKHALGILLNAGIAVRSIDVYPIFHDKYMVIDGRTVQTGSFNYTYSAAHRNAENVLVVWNAPELAAHYQADWQRNWALGRPVQLRY